MTLLGQRFTQGASRNPHCARKYVVWWSYFWWTHEVFRISGWLTDRFSGSGEEDHARQQSARSRRQWRPKKEENLNRRPLVEVEVQWRFSRKWWTDHSGLITTRDWNNPGDSRHGKHGWLFRFFFSNYFFYFYPSGCWVSGGVLVDFYPRIFQRKIKVLIIKAQEKAT